MIWVIIILSKYFISVTMLDYALAIFLFESGRKRGWGEAGCFGFAVMWFSLFRGGGERVTLVVLVLR